jgi:hypothetical protein
MKWIKEYSFFKEAKMDFQVQKEEEKTKSFYKPTNLLTEICVSMVLLNNNFLDNLLDRGLKGRYTENSQVFLTDLKNLLLAKNRLEIGKFVDNKCVTDEDISKVNGFFDEIKFDIEKDWNKLVDSRIIARNIIDKVLVDEKLTEDLIKKIYWIGPNKDKEHQEDIVVELNSGQQFSFYLSKGLSTTKSASFNTLADDLIGKGIEEIHNEEYTKKWDKLIQSWIKVLYENADKNIQSHIEKFIEPQRIDTISYFEYFNLKHRDIRYKTLGEHIKEFDKNILKFSDLMSEIWKNRNSCFMDPERVYNEWMELKIFILNSKILEHLFTESILKYNPGEIKKLDDNLKEADGKLKMKFIKTIVEKMGCLERPIFYLGNKGNEFYQVPSRNFFREHYDDLKIKFDYHVKLIVDQEDEEKNDFTIKIILELDEKPLIYCDIEIKFSGGEMSSKLTAKYKFTPVDNFNLRIKEKMLES